MRKPLGLFASLSISTLVHDNLFRHTECNALGRYTFHRTYFLLVISSVISSFVIFAVLFFSKHELAFTFAIYRRPSVCRLSSVTFVHPTQAIEIFGNVSMPFGRYQMA